ncbi:hypothetical protein WJX84_001793 [Apatococcus fuscideae]|uniref:SET domain-containing protein n=1 Tax=Apatococcus fuscideae TaxID=2026836 RepID=A0AAW1S6I0_9CHLO
MAKYKKTGRKKTTKKTLILRTVAAQGEVCGPASEPPVCLPEYPEDVLKDYNWQFDGSVASQPELRPGEKRVLGVTLDAGLVGAYNAAQEGAPDRCQVLLPDADEPIEQTPEFKKKVAESTEYFLRELTRGQGATSLVQSLPEDAAVSDCLEEFEVGNMEPGSLSSTKELGLRTKSDTCGLGTGAILGVYRGFMCSTLHFNQRWKCEPYTHWQPRLLSEFAYRMNVYAADLARPADCSQGLMKDVWQHIPQETDSLTVSAFMYGNSLSRANDARHDIKGGTDKKEDIAARRNAVLLPVVIGRWPFLFMVAIKGIGPNTEVLLDYETPYWHTIYDHRRFWQQDEAAQRARTTARRRLPKVQVATSDVPGATANDLLAAQPSVLGKHSHDKNSPPPSAKRARAAATSPFAEPQVQADSEVNMGLHATKVHADDDAASIKDGEPAAPAQEPLSMDAAVDMVFHEMRENPNNEVFKHLYAHMLQQHPGGQAPRPQTPPITPLSPLQTTVPASRISDLAEPANGQAGGTASPPNCHPLTHAGLNKFRQRFKDARAAMPEYAEPSSPPNDPDADLHCTAEAAAAAAPEQPTTPPWECRRETTPCFDENRLRFAKRQRPLPGSQDNPADGAPSELCLAMDSLLQRMQKRSGNPAAGDQACRDCEPEPKPVKPPKVFDPLGRHSQPAGAVKPLQHPPPIRAPRPQPLYDQPISPPRPVNLNNSPLKRRGPAGGRGGPLPNAFLPSSYSRHNPLGSRHGSGLASVSGNAPLLQQPSAAAGNTAAAPASQEARTRPSLLEGYGISRRPLLTEACKPIGKAGKMREEWQRRSKLLG